MDFKVITSHDDFSRKNYGFSLMTRHQSPIVITHQIYYFVTLWNWWIFLEIRHNSPKRHFLLVTPLHIVSVTVSRVYIIKYNDIQTVFFDFTPELCETAISKVLNALTKKLWMYWSLTTQVFKHNSDKIENREVFTEKKFSNPLDFVLKPWFRPSR